jgi:hypothetical protein
LWARPHSHKESYDTLNTQDTPITAEEVTAELQAAIADYFADIERDETTLPHPDTITPETAASDYGDLRALYIELKRFERIQAATIDMLMRDNLKLRQ